ncbi:IDEAL domain-containing protein [Heyndrickxia acidiproducens]|uniref:IDEAL domain-containing protein n=1 Tax=Heyndrickxia acidiproducens TaxID=1121084 RepID=UPI0003767BFF|nr:IDEAL domain-containing protein [Heyndrickxia acidiproducens]
MENKKSYSDLTKEHAMNQVQMEKFVDHIFTDMVLNEILLNKEREELLKQIDLALDLHDKEQFMKLTNELKQINLKFG